MPGRAALAAVFALTTAVGSFYALPEHRRLAAAIAWGDGGPSVDARLIVASWVNRVEPGVIAGPGAMVLASAVRAAPCGRSPRAVSRPPMRRVLDIADHDRLPGRFVGLARGVTARG